MTIYIIPDADKLSECVDFSKQYKLGWEFNDFMLPSVLDDKRKTARIIRKYKSVDMPAQLSTHGAFLDVEVHSMDEEIRKVSDMRIIQSIEVAKKLHCRKVIVHTGTIPNYCDSRYCDDWVLKNTEYWTAKSRRNPDIDILMENMFDMTPELMFRLAEAMEGVPNFGLCLDYAHATVFGEDADGAGEFVGRLKKYVRHIHVNDCDLLHDNHMQIGEGMIDWERFAEHYGESMNGVSILIEVNGLEKQKRSLDYLLELFSRHGITVG